MALSLVVGPGMFVKGLASLKDCGVYLADVSVCVGVCSAVQVPGR